MKETIAVEQIHNMMQENEIVLVDFSSDGCPPCDALRPVLQKLLIEERFKDIKFVEINLTKHPELAEEFMVFGVPTLMIFKMGKEYRKKVGYVTKKKLAKFLEEAKL